MKKKIFILVLLAICCMFVFSGCVSSFHNPSVPAPEMTQYSNETHYLDGSWTNFPSGDPDDGDYYFFLGEVPVHVLIFKNTDYSLHALLSRIVCAGSADALAWGYDNNYKAYFIPYLYRSYETRQGLLVFSGSTSSFITSAVFYKYDFNIYAIVFVFIAVIAFVLFIKFVIAFGRMVLCRC